MRIRVCPPTVFEGLNVNQAGIQLLGTGVFANHLRSGDGVVIYQPNSDYSECQILAICEVISTYRDSRRTSFDVRRVDGVIRPDSRVRWRWSKDPYLCLDVSRVKKYEILGVFVKVFGGDHWREDALEDCVKEVFQPDLSLPTLLPVEGVVYLMKSKSLYKIGKTIDLDNRKRTIERDVQETLEVVHTISSNDITRAELSLHEKFKSVRKRGEWFDLSPSHVSEICAIHRLEM